MEVKLMRERELEREREKERERNRVCIACDLHTIVIIIV